MTAATRPLQRPAGAKLLVVDANGTVTHQRRSTFARVLQPGDLIVANDAATLPASLAGTHERTGRTIEVRLAGRASLSPEHVHEFSAVVFGDGDFHLRTEDRPAPPELRPGDRLTLGPLRATVVRRLDHPRLVQLAFNGTAAAIWTGLARHGRPIQYAHLPDPLALWDTWTAIAAAPVAFEPPSAGFVLSWALLDDLRKREVRVATITHAAGISSTGDAELDARLPFDEPYHIPVHTSALVDDTRNRGTRVIAIGTTVVRALEHAVVANGHLRPGPGVATGRIGASTPLHVADALVSGTHEVGTSHHELLRAFASDEVLERVDRELEARGYLTHEFGDSIFIERSRSASRLIRPDLRADEPRSRLRSPASTAGVVP